MSLALQLEHSELNSFFSTNLKMSQDSTGANQLPFQIKRRELMLVLMGWLSFSIWPWLSDSWDIEFNLRGEGR